MYLSQKKCSCIFSKFAELLFLNIFLAILQRGYRVKLDDQKFTVPTDRVDMVCAKNAAEVLNEVRMYLCYSDAVWICFESSLQLNHLTE